MKMQTILLRRYAGLVLGLAALGLAASSCIQDEAAAGMESATVTMTFTTQAQAAPRAEDGSLEDNEQMKTLRVIVARSSDHEILYNWYDGNIDPSETERTVTFSELTVNARGEDFDFYAIANEAAFLSNGETLDGENINLDALYDRILNADFNATDSPLIPQAAFRTINVKAQAGGGIQQENMQLQFPVGKICVTFVNTTGEAQTLTDIRVAGVAPDRAYLFYQSRQPDGTTSDGDVDFAANLPLATGTENAPSTSQTLTRYIYPGAKSAGAYKLTATWNGQTREALLATADAQQGIDHIARGQQLNVTVTLKSDGGFFVKCVPQDWYDQSHDYELADKGVFTITEPNMQLFDTREDIKYFATQYVEDADAASRQLLFTLEMTSPEGVRWQAHLTNPQDFEFAGASEGVGGGGPVTLQVRPTKVYDATGERPETELYVTIGTSEDSQLFDQALDYAQSGTRLHIVQVSASEWEDITTTQP